MIAQQAFAQREDVSAVVGQLAAMPQVHGIAVEIEPIWVRWWALLSTYGPFFADRFQSSLLGEIYAYDPTAFFLPANGTLQAPNYRLLPRSYEEITQYVYNIALDEPFVLKAYVRPGASEVAFQPENRTVPVFFEVREPAMLTTLPTAPVRPLEGGTSIGDGGWAATLGGIVKDTWGKPYGVTCAHSFAPGASSVLQPAPIDHASPATIGNCVYRSTVAPLASAMLCNPSTGPGPFVDHDVALVEFDPAISAYSSIINQGPVVGTASKSTIYPSMPTSVMGRSHPKLRSLQVGNFVIAALLTSHPSGQPSQTFCYRNMFEVLNPTAYSFGSVGITPNPIHPGDSGAWACAGQEWQGLIVGRSNTVGYAHFAEDIVTHLQNHSVPVFI